jgi:1-acyl-sn-glycerol-3-phosphate acyltransferase
MLPFKKGAFVMAIDAGVPVVPGSLSGSARIMPKGEIRLSPSTVNVTIHQPISTASYSRDNIGELMSLTQDRVRSALSEEERAPTQRVRS